MDFKTSKQFQAPSVFTLSGRKSPLEDYSTSKDNSFGDNFHDPLCKLNLKETSDFVKAFPMTSKSGSRGLVQSSAQGRSEGVDSVGQRRSLEAPSTPGRPVFSFSAGNLSKKSIPSKWDDAEKWLINTSCHESPAHVTKPSDTAMGISGFPQKGGAFKEKVVSSASAAPSFDAPVVPLDPNLAFHGVPSEILLKDKFTDNVESVFPNFGYSVLEPTKDGFMLGHTCCETMKDGGTAVVTEVHRKDVGTEMTPLGSLTTSRCHTPITSSSPARHNTPANRSGPLVASNPSIDISELKDCHFAKLELSAQYDSMVSNWSTREEEEEEISKCLRHCEINGRRKSVAKTKASAWEDEERAKSCIRYQSEEEKIQAWLNLQSAKAEARSRKLEVKVQKMRSNLEEKLMKRMAIVHRKAGEWREAARLQHSQQISRASQRAQKMRSQQSSTLADCTYCGCFLSQH